MDKKKSIELHLLKKFISNPGFGLKVVSIDEGETPDFAVTTSNGRISIELTALINPEVKEVEAYRNKIIGKAEKRFGEMYGEDLNVWVTFANVSLKSGSAAAEEYANELFRAVKDIYIAHTGREFNISLDCNNFISYIHVTNTRGFKNWQHFGAHKVDWVNMDLLKRRIADKEGNIKKYKQCFDENWLLLISNLGNKSSSNRFDLLDFTEIQTSFDKVFSFSYMSDEIIQIK